MSVFKPSSGQTLDDRFLLGDELGRGGMSILFKAQDLACDRAPVVVKVPLPIFSSGTGAWSLFQREEEIGARLEHPYVLKFVRPQQVTEKRRSYVVMEYVPGVSLADRLKASGPFSEHEALSIASKICEALAYVHQHGVVHYDLKPANIMLCPDGSIRLIDFGMAHDAVVSRFSVGNAPPAIASSGYAAPEQIRRKRGRKSVDIYGIGAVLFEMLTGQPPFPGDDDFGAGSPRLVGDPPSPRHLNPSVSPHVEEIVLRALRREPAERYATAAAMKADLDSPEQVVVTGLAERLQPATAWRRNLRRARYVALVCIIPVAVQVALFVLLWRRFAHK
jgi:serine/threonine protein kinase